ncbi:unnamed protein product [Bursaphelenchus xylophilus]|uniref:(pine wood nematode) hypothetical protein n=1 Tax=Bursaphelenchus xylophilus TaxID=6326 RepID=A0A7I8XHY6_BURXY|nr:unnamed protein product [Bursaphelenchus xylophilus]CAG9084959.1 unnamed protein product [Bursaphelenchus xylophilus]
MSYSRTLSLIKHIQCRRSISNKIQRGHGITYDEKSIIGFSADQIFHVVYKVEDYPLFVPWCKNSVIHKRSAGILEAELFVGFPPLNEHYKSRVTTVYPYVIRSVCTDGRLFNIFDTIWRFGEAPSEYPKQTCLLHFTLEFEFKSNLYRHLANIVFAQVAKSMVHAFLKRAEFIYGPPSMKPETLK